MGIASVADLITVLGLYLELIAALRKEPDEARRRAPPLYWAGFICHGQATAELNTLNK